MFKIILLGILALLVFILLLKLRLAVLYQDDAVTVTLHVLCLRFGLYPAKEKKPKKRKQEPAPQPAKTEPEQPRPKQPLSERIGAVLDLLGPLPACIQRLLRHTKIKRVFIRIVVAEQDAAQTAISYGRTCAVVHGALAALRNFLNIQVKSIQIHPDFTAEQGSVRVSGRVEVRVGTILLCGLQYLWSYLKTILHKSHEFSRVKAKDGVQK